MAPTVLIALMLMMTGEEAPIATQATPAPPPPRADAPAPMSPAAQAAAQQLLASMPVSNIPPTDDYGYVSWCYGALSTYLALYDRAMPEVTRIENEFPGPEGIANDLKVYPALRPAGPAGPEALCRRHRRGRESDT